MKTAKVAKCKISGCAYNINGLCHAPAITIGQDRHPICHTFSQSAMNGQTVDTGSVAGVGACEISSCIYNADLKCQSQEILVDYREQQPQCVIFQQGYNAGKEIYEIISHAKSDDFEYNAPEIFIG
jgi:hypothetical protein